MEAKTKKRSSKAWILFSFILFTIVFISYNCEDNNYREDKIEVYPPDANAKISVTTYFPDSGGRGTQLILRGKNFGTDTSYLKVTVNGKNAGIIGVNNDIVYTMVPARADTGLVRLYVGKGENVKEFVYENEFKYFFKKNVTTYMGKVNSEGTDDGDATVAKFRRPYWLDCDRDGALYVVEEGTYGRDGAVRRIYGGVTSTLLRNSGDGNMQNPTSIAFDLTQDTIYVGTDTEKSNQDKPITSDLGIGYLARETGFNIIKPLVRSRGVTTVAVHPKTGALFYNNKVDGSIYRYDPATGSSVLQFSLGLDTNTKMAISQDGKIAYFIINNRHVVYKATFNAATGNFENAEAFAGKWDAAGRVDGLGQTARFDRPAQGVVDEDGNLFIAERHLHGVRKVTPEGVVTVYAGIQAWGHKDGDPATAQFRDAEGITIAPDGAIYLAEVGAHLIRRIMVE